MSVFSFMKNIGENLFYKEDEAAWKAQGIYDEERTKGIRRYLDELNIIIADFELEIQDEKATLLGTAKDQETFEKTIIAVGNIQGISTVESKMNVQKPAQLSRFYTIKPGDTLNKLALEYFDDSNKFKIILEANQPLIKKASHIYSGMVIRIPRERIA